MLYFIADSNFQLKTYLEVKNEMWKYVAMKLHDKMDRRLDAKCS